MDNLEFIEAIWHSDLAFVRRYLQQRSDCADLGRSPDGDSPLHLCVRANAQPELFALLLRPGGCCPADRNQDGCLAEDLFVDSKFGPLYREELDCLAADAIRSGRIDRLETWLLRGWSVPDCREEAFRALVVESTVTAEQLEAIFADLTRLQASIDRLHEGPLERLREGGDATADSLRLLESLDQCGLTLLHKATLAGDTEAVRCLLAARPDLVGWPDCLGRSAAFYCDGEVEGNGETLGLLMTAMKAVGLSDDRRSWNPHGCQGATASEMRARLLADHSRRRPRLQSVSADTAAATELH